MRISTGVLPSAEEVEFFEILKGKKKAFGRRKEFRKSDGRPGSSPGKKTRLQAARLEKLNKMSSFFPADPELLEAINQVATIDDERRDLKQIISSMSRFLKGLQERL